MRVGTWSVWLVGLLLLAGCDGAESDSGQDSAGAGGDAGAGGATFDPFDPSRMPTPVSPPPVELPPRPAGFDLGAPLGAPGWRDSTESFCSPWVGNEMGAALWSTPDAVYVTVTMQCVTPLGGGPHDEYCSAPGGAFQSLYVNQGRGWRAVHHHQRAPYLEPVGALESGDLISVGWHCAVWKSSLDGSLECLGQRSSGSRSAFVRNDAVFHLGHDANHDNPVTRYADGAWTYLAHFTNFDDPRLLVDLGSRVLVAGGDGFAATLDPETGGTQRIAAPAGDYSEGVSWPDGRFALLHTAGLNYRVVLGGSAGWTTVGLELGIDSKLRAGPDSALYTNVENALYRIDETGAYEAVLELQDAGVRDFRVNTDSEVFLSIEYPALQPYQCGRVVMAWFDGNQLHLM